MKRKAALIILSLLLFLLLVSCTFSFDGSTAIQEVFANELYDEGVYLDKGGMTLIIKQDKSVTPLDYYILTISKLNSDSITTIKIEYESSFDIIEDLDIERGIYTFQVTGYKDEVEVCSGIEENYMLKDGDSILTLDVLAKGHTHEIVWQNDETYHWKGCKYCNYIEDGTKEKHSYTLGDESDPYCICGRHKPIETTASGFSATEADIEPKGHFKGTKEGTEWTLSYVDENTSYPAHVLMWSVDGEEVSEASSEIKIDINPYERVLVFCLFANDKAYGSYEAMIDGNWENYK